MSIKLVMPSNHLILSSPSLPALNLSQHQGLSNEVAKILELQPNEYSGLMSFRIDFGSLCSPRDSQESSPTPQFKSINSLALSLLYGPALTSLHDYWKTHSFDYTWDQTHVPCIGRWILNHWTTKKVPGRGTCDSHAVFPSCSLSCLRAPSRILGPWPLPLI